MKLFLLPLAISLIHLDTVVWEKDVTSTFLTNSPTYIEDDIFYTRFNEWFANDIMIIGNNMLTSFIWQFCCIFVICCHFLNRKILELFWLSIFLSQNNNKHLYLYKSDDFLHYVSIMLLFLKNFANILLRLHIHLYLLIQLSGKK